MTSPYSNHNLRRGRPAEPNPHFGSRSRTPLSTSLVIKESPREQTTKWEAFLERYKDEDEPERVRANRSTAWSQPHDGQQALQYFDEIPDLGPEHERETEFEKRSHWKLYQKEASPEPKVRSPQSPLKAMKTSEDARQMKPISKFNYSTVSRETPRSSSPILDEDLRIRLKYASKGMQYEWHRRRKAAAMYAWLKAVKKLPAAQRIWRNNTYVTDLPGRPGVSAKLELDREWLRNTAPIVPFNELEVGIEEPLLLGDQDEILYLADTSHASRSRSPDPRSVTPARSASRSRAIRLSPRGPELRPNSPSPMRRSPSARGEGTPQTRALQLVHDAPNEMEGMHSPNGRSRSANRGAAAQIAQRSSRPRHDFITVPRDSPRSPTPTRTRISGEVAGGRNSFGNVGASPQSSPQSSKQVFRLSPRRPALRPDSPSPTPTRVSTQSPLRRVQSARAPHHSATKEKPRDLFNDTPRQRETMLVRASQSDADLDDLLDGVDADDLRVMVKQLLKSSEKPAGKKAGPQDNGRTSHHRNDSSQRRREPSVFDNTLLQLEIDGWHDTSPHTTPPRPDRSTSPYGEPQDLSGLCLEYTESPGPGGRPGARQLMLPARSASTQSPGRSPESSQQEFSPRRPERIEQRGYSPLRPERIEQQENARRQPELSGLHEASAKGVHGARPAKSAQQERSRRQPREYSPAEKKLTAFAPESPSKVSQALLQEMQGIQETPLTHSKQGTRDKLEAKETEHQRRLQAQAAGSHDATAKHTTQQKEVDEMPEVRQREDAEAWEDAEACGARQKKDTSTRSRGKEDKSTRWRQREETEDEDSDEDEMPQRRRKHEDDSKLKPQARPKEDGQEVKWRTHRSRTGSVPLPEDHVMSDRLDVDSSFNPATPKSTRDGPNREEPTSLAEALAEYQEQEIRHEDEDSQGSDSGTPSAGALSASTRSSKQPSVDYDSSSRFRSPPRRSAGYSSREERRHMRRASGPGGRRVLMVGKDVMNSPARVLISGKWVFIKSRRSGL
ncbi:hypothetical protein CYMTET_8570 [Cymbomonas tetramitiformis]|uniref:Uncharacterized protein n=1 Tax=Cymbomonas tetramitiformis TaxID=36881 RepID=A0AAE0GUM2_9CHLO|nr:hypothetical protein CYMTET_8570 [Cymbomonas tetramitiformis]